MPFVLDDAVASGWYLAQQATPNPDAVVDTRRHDTATISPHGKLKPLIDSAFPRG